MECQAELAEAVLVLTRLRQAQPDRTIILYAIFLTG